MRFYLVYKNHGLYDPVLDDYEPIYEPIDQEDTDLPSDPSEVLFKVAEFIEVPPPLDSRSLTASPFVQPTKPYRPFSTEPLDVPPLEDPIILNPEYKDVFPQHEVEDILQIKPDIPPESKFKLPISEQYDPEGKKLKKLVEQTKQEKTVDFKEDKREERKESKVVHKETKDTKQEAKYLEKMKKEIDLDKIEMTASEIVDESIQKAVSVAEEIKREIDIEISSKFEGKIEKSEIKSEKREAIVEKEVMSQIKEKQESNKVEVKEDAKAVSDLVELIDKTTEEIIKQSEVKDVKKKFEKLESGSQEDASVEERKLSTKQEIEETIEAGSVRRKSMLFESEAKVVEEQKDVEIIKSGETRKDKQATQQERIKEVEYKKDAKAETLNATERRRSDAKMSTSRLLAEQRAYTIGLQTIPNIRGSVHSSHHYNLLLKTFFIHLTDVMVALSRFILSEPVFSEERKVSEDFATVTESVTKDKEKIKKESAQHKEDIVQQEKIVKEVQVKAAEAKKEVSSDAKQETGKTIIVKDQKDKIEQHSIVKDKKDVVGVQKVEEKQERIEQKIAQDEIKQVFAEQKRQKVEEKVIKQDAKQDMSFRERDEYIDERRTVEEDFDEEFYEEEEFIEMRRKTGAEMAQMAERKSADLIEKLDAVITEFQGKAGIEVPDKNVTIHRRTRSRSRSKAQEQGERDSVPLEMSYESGRQSLDITEMQKMSRSQRKAQDQSVRESVPSEMSYEAGRHSQEITEMQKLYSSQSYESKKMERRHESRELVTPVPQTQDGKVTYVAIVESHVYTNKDAIFDEMAQSTETKVSMESRESSKTEKVAMESKVTKEEVAQTVIQKAQEIEQKAVEIIQPIQIVEDIKSVQTHQASTVIETAATEIAESSEVVIEEVHDEVLKIKEPPAKSVEIVYESTAKSVAESTEAYVEEVKAESLEISAPKAIQAKEIVETAAKSVAEATEVSIEEVKHEEFTVQEPVVTQAAEVLVENKATEIAEATSVPVEKGKTYDEASAELKIVKFEPVDVEEPVVVISEVELALHKRDVDDSKIYESIVGVQTDVQEKHESLDVSQVASYKSVGESKLEKTVNIEEVEEIPVQVIAKTEVSIEGLNESDTKVYQEALTKESVDESYKSEALTLETSVESREEHVEQSSQQRIEAVVEEASFESKSVSEASFEARSVAEASFEASSVSQASFEAKSVQEVSFEATSVSEASFQAKSISTSKQVKETVEQSYESESQETKKAVVSEQKLPLQKEPVTNGELPSPTEPATPVTDEYMFKLEIPLPKTTIPVPRDCTPPNDEDPHIVKKKLVPEIDTTIESYIYEPPLPTPPAGRELGSPEYKRPGLQGGSNRLKNMRYYKPGLRGGADKPEITKEEIMEIERTSSLLASEIDKTIKSIEEYKEEVGIEAKKEVTMSSKMVTSSKFEHKKTVTSNGHTESAKEIRDNYEKEWKEIEKQIQNNHKDVNELSVNVTIEEANGDSKNGKEKSDDRVQIIEVEVSARNGHSKSKSDAKNVVHEESVKTETESKSTKSNGFIKISLDLEDSSKKDEETVKETSKTETQEESVKVTQNGYKEENVKEDQTVQNMPVEVRTEVEEPKVDPMQLYKPVKFDPEEIARRKQMASVPVIQEPPQGQQKPKVYMTETGEIIGSHQGIVDGLEEAVVDSEIAKALGKPGLPDEKIAELISGEAEMLREAHVMGVDFQKIKPVIESLKDSEVLKALNEEVLRAKEQKKKEEKKWTTFLQKPKRPVPKPKFGYYRYVEEEKIEEEPYKVKIVKQPKPKVAPDYKPEDFDTGPLPWEQPQPELVPGAPPVEPEEPILIPEEEPEFLEAVDPLPESEVPDLEDTGIPLPPPPQPRPVQVIEPEPEPQQETEAEELDLEAVVQETEQIVEEMEGERLAEQLLQNVQRMVDPNATLEQQLSQMRAQIAALAQLPCVIQQTLDLVTRQISQLSHQETVKAQEEKQYQVTEESYETVNLNQQESAEEREEREDQQQSVEITEQTEEQENVIKEEEEERVKENVQEESKPMLSEEELARRKKQEEEMMAEQQKIEKQRKDVIEQMKLEHESRQVKQRPTPRVGKPKPMFGPPTPVNRPLVLPGGRKWRRPQDVYNEQLIAETLNAQSEIIQGKVMGPSFESVRLPYDERINFMKYEKPPVNLDHLQNSEVYKVVHNLDEKPLKRVETLTPVIAEADYRERCRSISPFPGAESHLSIPPQLQP